MLWILSCTPAEDPPWWESPAPCPAGSRLVLSLPPEDPALLSTDIENRMPYFAHCSKFDAIGRIGPATGWYANGQMAHTGHHLLNEGIGDGDFIPEARWDEDGRQFLERVCEAGDCVDIRTWWHSDEQPGIRGAKKDHHRVGLWQEWDPSGALVASAQYDDEGVLREKSGDEGALILLAPDLERRAADDAPWSRSRALVRPTSAQLVVVDGEQISVNLRTVWNTSRFILMAGELREGGDTVYVFMSGSESAERLSIILRVIQDQGKSPVLRTRNRALRLPPRTGDGSYPGGYPAFDLPLRAAGSILGLPPVQEGQVRVHLLDAGGFRLETPGREQEAASREALAPLLRAVVDADTALFVLPAQASTVQDVLDVMDLVLPEVGALTVDSSPLLLFPQR